MRKLSLRRQPFNPLQQFTDRWSSCTRCPLSKNRYKVVLYRGNIPADVLFIGEAPGQSEDTLGQPFRGPAGRVLDDILRDAKSELLELNGKTFTFALTNVVCCIPEITAGDIESGDFDESSQLGIRDPTKAEAEACNPRLLEFVALVKPRLIVRLGKVSAASTADLVAEAPMRSLIHPAAILRMENPSAQRDAFDRCVARLVKWITEL